MDSKHWRIFLVLILLALMVFGAYFKVFKAEFVYDDFGFVVNNKDIQSFRPFSKFFLSPDIFTGSNYAAENVGAKNWRPISSLAFAIEYRLFGSSPFGFHLISILLHLINTVLVYLLITKITSRKGVAFVITSLWALHPALTEAVSWIANQSSLIFLGFFLLTILAILGYLKDKNKKFLLWLSYLFFTLSLLTKETALGGIFIIPFVFLLEHRGQEKINFRKILINSYPFVLIGLAYFYLHYKILGALGDHALRGSFLKNLLLAPVVFYKYISLVFYPVGLLLDYSDFPLPSGAGDPRVIAGALSVVFLAALIYLGFKKYWFNFVIGIVWFLAFLSPVLQIIPFHDIIGERFLYAPLVGFFLALILGFDKEIAYVKARFNVNLNKVGAAALVLVLSAFFVLTFNRNNDWLNSENLWNSVLRVDPKNEKSLSNLGGYYVSTGQTQKVIELSEKLLQINPENISGNLNLGAGLAMAGRFEEAKSKFFYVLLKKPDYQPALVSLATLYQNVGRYDKALEIVQNLNSRYPEREDIKLKLLELQKLIKYNKFSSNINTSGVGKGQSPYIEAELQAPAVEGNIVNSGIYGRVFLNGAPFEASLDIFSAQGGSVIGGKTSDALKPVISIRTHNDGTFQIPLKPGFYFLKALNSGGSIFPIREEYSFNLGANRWLQFKIEYK